MRFIKNIILELLGLFAFCAAFFLFIIFSETPISRWFGYVWIALWYAICLACIIAVSVEYGKDIIKIFYDKWVQGGLLFFGWGILWYNACNLIDKISGLSHETIFFFTFMPSFGVFGYFTVKILDNLKQRKNRQQ